jgi:hypothetical protein
VKTSDARDQDSGAIEDRSAWPTAHRFLLDVVPERNVSLLVRFLDELIGLGFLGRGLGLTSASEKGEDQRQKKPKCADEPRG